MMRNHISTDRDTGGSPLFQFVTYVVPSFEEDRVLPPQPAHKSITHGKEEEEEESRVPLKTKSITKKPRKPFVMTPARAEAFARCKLKRQANIEARRALKEQVKEQEEARTKASKEQGEFKSELEIGN